jgi:predicted CopG family antitoxin
MKTIKVSDEVYDYLKGMVDDEHISNSDSSPELNENGETCAYRPTFSEVIGHLIEDREAEPRVWQITEERKDVIGICL